MLVLMAGMVIVFATAALIASWPFRHVRGGGLGMGCIVLGAMALGAMSDGGWECCTLTPLLERATQAQEGATAPLPPETPAPETPAPETPAPAPTTEVVPPTPAPESAEAPVAEALPTAEATAEQPLAPPIAAESTKPEADTLPAASSPTPAPVAEPETAAAGSSDIAPAIGVVIPPGRPDWVERDFSHDPGDVQRVAVYSEACIEKHEALHSLDQRLVEAARKYIAEYTGNRAASTLVPINAGYIRRHLVRPENVYSEVLQTSAGQVHQVHALVEFDDNFRQHVQERWNKILVSGRLVKLGVIAGGVLLALSVVLGFFKADTATRGYHTRRLRFASALALAALVAGGIVLLRTL